MKKKRQTTFINRASSTSRDVVGLEIGAGLPQGVPTVRINASKGQTELLTVGFLQLDDKIPLNANDAESRSPHWMLPKKFQASRAAIAVTSPQATLRQTMLSTIEPDSEIKLRTSTLKTDRDHPPIVAAMPDFIAAWIAKRFPEGRRPTTRSIQTSTTAALNSFLAGPVARNSDKTTLVVFCHQNHSSITIFFEGKLTLYREHPVGYMTVKESISEQMNISIEMVETIMNDPVVDISSSIEAPLQSLFRQVDITADYIARRKNCAIDKFYAYGVPFGAKHWTAIFQKTVRKPMRHLHPFGGISRDNKRLTLPDTFKTDAPLFMNALGAARALAEDL